MIFILSACAEARKEHKTKQRRADMYKNWIRFIINGFALSVRHIISKKKYKFWQQLQEIFLICHRQKFGNGHKTVTFPL
jgi:hypothetical protein